MFFAFTLLAGCSEPSSSNSEASATVSETPSGDDPGTVPGEDSEVIEPKFYVGLPGEREDRFSIAYAQAENLTLNPFLDVQETDVFMPHNFVYDKLLHYNKSGGLYESNILESIDLNGSELHLRLYSDISFHNGFSLSANDVIQTFLLYQSSGHELGQQLDESTASFSMDDNFTIRVILSDNENAALTLFDCMGKIPILPYQIWGARIPAGTDLKALQEINPLPAIGSGPYRLLREDDYVLILEKLTQQTENVNQAFYDNYPQYLVYYKYQRGDLALAALAHNDLDILLRPEDAHPLEAKEDILESFADIPFWEQSSAENIFTLSVQEKRMGIALNPASEHLERISARRAVQSILLRLANTQQGLYPRVPNIVSLPAGNQLTLPSILPHTLTRVDYQLLPDTSPQMTNIYLSESGWERDPLSGLIVDENDEIVELDFYYPVSTTELSNVCRQIADIAKENGLAIVAREVSADEWQKRLQERDYDLIYMESLADESLPQMISRIQLWPGLEAWSEQEDNSDFAAESGRNLLRQCRNDALAFNSIIAHLKDLNVFLIENNLFIPLGIAYETGGIGNVQYFSSDLSEDLQNH
ncbi:MAG: ABC transporter substrate-binding protein [Eubacteriales bacterium]|nr:ABC transporter substrate-binding protein [Eubacteriales bacterium]